MKSRIFSVCIAVLLVLVAACSPAVPTVAPAAAPKVVPSQTQEAEEIAVTAKQVLLEVTIKAHDFSFDFPESVKAGWTRVTLNNSGNEPHHVQIFRLNDGATLEQFTEALTQGIGPALATVKHVGGVGVIAPALSASAVVNLVPGNYIMLCFVPSPGDNVSHLVKGMISGFTVEPNDVGVEEPKADFTVDMADFSYDMPEKIPAGGSLVRVVNSGVEPHELNILQLAEGKTKEDVMLFLEKPNGPPPYTPVGGMQGLEPTFVGFMELDLAPGKYVAVCYIPSFQQGEKPHFMLGMIKEFEIE